MQMKGIRAECAEGEQKRQRQRGQVKPAAPWAHKDMLTCGAVAGLGVVVALAGLTRALVEPVVALTAPVTLQARDTNFALALPRAAEGKTNSEIWLCWEASKVQTCRQVSLSSFLLEAGHETQGQPFPKSDGELKKGRVSAKPVALTAISSWAPGIIAHSRMPWPRAIPLPQPQQMFPQPLWSSCFTKHLQQPCVLQDTGTPVSLCLSNPTAPTWVILSPAHQC